MLKETVLREFEGQVVVNYDDLAPSDWLELLSIRRDIKEKAYKSMQDNLNKDDKGNENAGKKGKEILKQTELANHRMAKINHMLQNAPKG